jgi:ferric-dicitrate binding protein FerR (iron transport regulator)
MEQDDDVRQLLREVRDLQREHLAEYRRVSEQLIAMQRAAAERSEAQYARSIEHYRKATAASRSYTWALYLLFGLCLGANLFILARVSGGR